MAIHDNHVVDVIKLKNKSATVCNLQVCYKVGENGDVHNAGKATDNFPKGQESYLRLEELTKIPDGAFVDVKGATKDKRSDEWVVYRKGSGNTAVYTVEGSVFSVDISYDGLKEGYLETGINFLKLANKSGTVCGLECYYKVNKGDSPKRAGSTNHFPSGKSETLDLISLGIPEGAYVTAYADISGASDKNGGTWLVYKKEAIRSASFELKGSVFEAYMRFVGVNYKYPVYHNEKVHELRLFNSSATVCALGCYYKVNKEDTPTAVGLQNFIPVEQGNSLRLIDYAEIPDGAYVTAFVDIKGPCDCSGSEWYIYEKKAGRCVAFFTLHGTIFDPELRFDEYISN